MNCFVSRSSHINTNWYLCHLHLLNRVQKYVSVYRVNMTCWYNIILKCTLLLIFSEMYFFTRTVLRRTRIPKHTVRRPPTFYIFFTYFGDINTRRLPTFYIFFTYFGDINT